MKMKPRWGQLTGVLVVCVMFLMPDASGQEIEQDGLSILSDSSVQHALSRGTRIEIHDLDRILHPVLTITEFHDGTVEYYRGSGFVVGHRFYTVNHNLGSSGPAHAVTRKSTYVDGVPVTASYVNLEHDIAVFELSPNVCRLYCNEFSFSEKVVAEPERRIYWLRKFENDFVIKEGRVLNYAWIGEVVDIADEAISTCRGNLIVEVDTPFIPGSSGSPVIDTASGHILGIIQGNFDDGTTRRGYFKPMNCVETLLRENA